MLRKEEFQKEYIRMMDSVRNEDKGTPSCNGVHCEECDLCNVCEGENSLGYKAFEIIEIVEQWSKEHPIKTNAQKFKEVFGFKPNDASCVLSRKCSFCPYVGDGLCTIGFWSDEYKTPEVKHE